MKCSRCQHENPPQSRFCHAREALALMRFWLEQADAELAELR